MLPYVIGFAPLAPLYTAVYNLGFKICISIYINVVIILHTAINVLVV